MRIVSSPSPWSKRRDRKSLLPPGENKSFYAEWRPAPRASLPARRRRSSASWSRATLDNKCYRSKIHNSTQPLLFCSAASMVRAYVEAATVLINERNSIRRKACYRSSALFANNPERTQLKGPLINVTRQRRSLRWEFCGTYVKALFICKIQYDPE